MCLAIIPASGHAPTAQAVLEHLHGAGLSKFDMPEYFLCLDKMPTTASGKILKRELVDWIKTGRIHPTPVRWTSTG